jgi:hypothetical protein
MHNLSCPGVTPGTGTSVTSSRTKTRLADALYVLAWRRAVAELERERRRTLIQTLRLLRPGVWVVDRDGAGHERVLGYCADQRHLMAELAKVAR